ncbi:BNR-4 repeat-containing protein [Paludisphaera mucosa]|uniref:BNR-4 repeat-containing protein n=1 Tax=Paludisphaera mucosa TaxID=3030827 RepID=A0ABT6FDN6_9BACT|nr:BNR-4 repeat-containing protein [Paludisphaera mucosa]MDG3005686.1 BNR-4 repeat-containing protein [Paludisphaera mucosa]
MSPLPILLLTALLAADGPDALPRAGGYVGCWYSIGATKNAYRYKYSGGLATYPQQQSPIAVYDAPSNRTFFVYGGADPARKSILHMVSYYDHATGTVPRPAILLDKKTNDAHDNPCLAIDDEGFLWVFSNAHGTARPSFIHRSVAPRSIDAFEKVAETNFSYGHPRFVPGRGFLFLHTKYKAGRGLRFAASPDGRTWPEPSPLAHIDQGDYQVTGARGQTVATVFEFHPSPLGLDARTNLYFLATDDFGATWKRADGRTVALPLVEPDNPALIHDYRSEGKLVYLKDLNFDAEVRPVVLYLTSRGHMPGPEQGPHEWRTSRWDGQAWVDRPFTMSDHNYDHGSLYIEADGLWRVIAPTEPGAQPFGTGGDMVMWTSADQGASWTRVKQLTSDRARNHTYARRPIAAHPDFYAIWADGDARAKSESSLYFTDRLGTAVRRLPVAMTADVHVPEVVE